jgi:hypothetical protein
MNCPGKNIDDMWLYGGFPDGGIFKSQSFRQMAEKLSYTSGAEGFAELGTARKAAKQFKNCCEWLPRSTAKCGMLHKSARV